MRAFQDAVRRRAVEREPVAYILGRRGFRRSSCAVDARALMPRPETELLVEVGARRCRAGARVLDVGTGSGAVALALKRRAPGPARSTGSDLSDAALELARANARAARARRRVAAAPTCSTGVPDEFDAILANLPYVAESRTRGARARDPAPRASRGAVRRPRRARRDPRAARAAGARDAGADWWRSRSAPGRRAPSRELVRDGGLRRTCAPSATWRGSSGCVVGRSARDERAVLERGGRGRACEECVARRRRGRVPGRHRLRALLRPRRRAGRAAPVRAQGPPRRAPGGGHVLRARPRRSRRSASSATAERLALEALLPGPADAAAGQPRPALRRGLRPASRADARAARAAAAAARWPRWQRCACP